MNINLDEIESRVSFCSDAERLAGKLGLPRGLRPGERRAAVIIMHGFGGTMEDGLSRAASQLLAKLGYVTLRFDFRGCGESSGERGLVRCEDEVVDALNAVSFMEGLPEVDPKRIGMLGGSLAGSVAIQAAGTDTRIAACISCGGLGSGETTFRFLHPAGEAWQRFNTMVEEGRRRRGRGETMMVPRFDIIPIPPAVRPGLPAGAIMEFPFEVVESILRLRPIDVVGKIAPRPLLLLHPAADPVVASEESIALFRNAGQPADLHLVSNNDHFMLSEDSWISLDILKNWLKKYFPPTASTA
jgi:hypothetical protein